MNRTVAARLQRNSLRSVFALVVFSALAQPSLAQTEMPPPWLPKHDDGAAKRDGGAAKHDDGPVRDEPRDYQLGFDTLLHFGKPAHPANPNWEGDVRQKALDDAARERALDAPSRGAQSPAIPPAYERRVERAAKIPKLDVSRRVGGVTRPRTIGTEREATFTQPPVLAPPLPTLAFPSAAKPQPTASDAAIETPSKIPVVPIAIVALLGVLAALGYALRHYFGLGSPLPNVKAHLDRGVVAAPRFAEDASGPCVSLMVSSGTFESSMDYSKAGEAS